MLRMGRNQKPEPAQPEPVAPRSHQPAPAPPPVTSAPTPGQSAPAPPPPAAPHTLATAEVTAAAGRAVSETESLARGIKEGQVGGFVGLHSMVTGETEFKGMLRVDGRLAGHVRSHDGTLIVSSGGQVDADVDVAVAKINGTVNGDIHAHTRIEFGRTARVNGNVQTPALVIEQGAIFEGTCRMSALQSAAPHVAAPGPDVTPGRSGAANARTANVSPAGTTPTPLRESAQG